LFEVGEGKACGFHFKGPEAKAGSAGLRHDEAAIFEKQGARRCEVVSDESDRISSIVNGGDADSRAPMPEFTMAGELRSEPSRRAGT